MWLLVPLLTTQFGCPLVSDLPDRFDVAISTAETREAAKDTGPASLAGASWRIFRKANPNETPTDPSSAPRGPYGGLLDGGLLERPPGGAQIFVVEFAADGPMTAVRENKFFLAEIYGTEVPVGADWTPTVLPLVSYRSASYGVQVGERFGLAVVVQVRLGFSFVGRAVLYAWGTGDADRLEGMFGYLLDFTGGLGEALLGARGDQYEFFAERAE
ncbi:MAG: hypothetical protein KDA32_12475 [Phycisphaerales bacterium]|nr:hypothetical protein [Phycisphaerales bacterium]